MEEDLVDYSSESMDAMPIWMDDPPQCPTRKTPENPHEPNHQVGAFIIDMEDEVSTLKDLGFV